MLVKKYEYRYKPFTFFISTLFLTWILGFIVAFLSNNSHLITYKNILIYSFVFPPTLVALLMIFGSQNDALINNFKNRLINLKLIQWPYLLVILLIMPLTVVTATFISLLFGHGLQQFALMQNLTDVGSFIPTLFFMVILAPMFEEIGWRGYGVDSLAKPGRSLLISTLIFGVLWNLFHIPLFFIKGYYHYEILHTHLIYAFNFILSVFVLAFLANWIYYKNGRSIPANFLLHAMANLSFSIIQIDQFTKCIITILLLVISIIVFIKLKPWWLNKNLSYFIS